MAYKTPGVYVKEIALFPPSVAEVPTAIPAFIGYTAKAERRGRDLTNQPTRIDSILEYRDRFGFGFPIATANVVVDPANNSVKSVNFAKRFHMYDALQLFFDNGGGKCYIISVGSYADTVALGDDTTGLKGGLKALEKYDEPTMILFPDAVLLDDESQFAALQQSALAQCTKLQDRVSILDLNENVSANGNGALRDHIESVEAFRNNIGINSLKYGAAYTPWLFTAYEQKVDFKSFRDNVTDGASPTPTPIPLDTISSDAALNELVANTNNAIKDQVDLDASVAGLLTAPAANLEDHYTVLSRALGATDPATADHEAALAAMVSFVQGVALEFATWKDARGNRNLNLDVDTYASDKLRSAIGRLVSFEKNADVRVRTGVAAAADVETIYGPFDATGWLGAGASVSDFNMDPTVYAGAGKPESLLIARDLRSIFDLLNAFADDVLEAAATHKGLAQSVLYQDHAIIGAMVERIEQEMSRVPPSGAIAGIYAKVDNLRGVWKAPANVTLSSVREPTVPIDFFDQEELNVDVVAGKSINAIRTFTGKGVMVWGARTLAGNDNEWRYVPVRRFFNMVEESIMKSTGWAVFEPNDANLWTKLKGMIDNYLIQKWREGALQGAVPEDAFFVKVGLGETMMAQDILEGRLIIEIGMAVVRPAEFIILKFMHKMPVS